MDTLDLEKNADVIEAKQRLDAPTHAFEAPVANRLGDYELIRELGRGGMGAVYEARHSKTGILTRFRQLFSVAS